MENIELINELISDLCLLSNDGLPHLESEKSIWYIYEFFEERGQIEFGKMVIQNLLEDDKQFKDPALNKVIKYKNVNGKDAEGKVGNLLRRPKEEDAHQKALAALGGEDSDVYKKAMDVLGGEGQPQRDIEKEREAGDESDDMDGGEAPQTGTAFDPKTKGGSEYLENLPEDDPAKRNIQVYPLGGGYYSDKPDGEPKYKSVDEIIESTTITADTPKEDDKKLVVLGDKEIKKVKDKVTRTKKTVGGDAVSLANKEQKKTELKEKFSKKGDISENMVSDEGKLLSNGTKVRDILDGKGVPIQVNTTEGRKEAAEIIRARLSGLDSKIKEAIKNFSVTVEVKKWLGELGEMSALAQILEEDVEAYLLTDSERKNDIVFIKPSGNTGSLDTGYLSVKTTLQGEQVNKLGANCKADLDKLSESAKPVYETTVNGKSFNLKPTNVLGSIIDIKSGFFAKFSVRDGVQKTSKGKLTKVNPEIHRDVADTAIIDIGGVTYFKDQSSYLKNTTVTDSDINEFFDKEADKYLTTLSKPKKGESNKIQDPDEVKQTKEYLKEMFLNDYARKKADGTSYSLYDMHETMYYTIGKTASDADMPIEATTDTMAIQFSQNSINPNVSVIKKEDANADIEAQLNKNKSIGDERERIADLATGCLNIRSRTRAIGNPMRYDGIDNISPIAKKPTEKRTPIAEYIKS